ncbi:MAG: type II secretion system F family protein [Granulosicoccaceae bacterium]
MRRYRLSVLDVQGGSREFELFAESREQLQHKIAEHGWIVLKVSKLRERSLQIKADELVLLCQHLQLVLEAGMPVHDALLALADECESRPVQHLCLGVAQYVESGEPLSIAFAHSKLDSFFLAMVRTGEKTGQLPDMLHRAAEHLQWRQDMRRKVAASLSYPLLVLASLLVVVPLLFIYLVPQLLGFLANQQSQLPWYTQWLISVANFAETYGLVVAAGSMVALACLYVLYLASAWFRRRWDRLALKVPLLGSLFMQLHTAQLAEQLGIMYSAGIPVTEALPLICDSLGNQHLRSSLARTNEQLQQGQSLHESLPANVFPALLLRLVKVGEMSGKLDTSLAQAAKLYARQAHRRSDKLAAVVGPLVLLLAGLLIIWLVAALILPLYDGLFSMDGAF